MADGIDLAYQARPDTLISAGRRYTMVGAACAAIHNVVMIGSDFLLGIHYFPATLVSLVLVTPLGYALHCRFTFGRPRSWPGFLRFMAGIAVGYPLSLALMVLLVSILGLPVWIAVPVATLLLFVWNFLSAHWAILRHLRLRLC